MDYVILTYSVYLIIALSLTIWVARTLLKNGKTFLLDIFHKEEVLSTSLSNLLNVGVYLISIGFAFTMLRIYNAEEIINMQRVIEILSQKLGAFIIVLGVILFLELLILLSMRGFRRITDK